MSIREALRRAAHRLAEAGSDEANLEAELLLAHTLDLDRVHLYQRLNDELTDERDQTYRGLLERRLAHEPAAYITGHKEFYGLEFEVTPAAIIPRPETEVLVELALDFIETRDRRQETRVADIGVGCGAIAVAVAHELPRARVVATDTSAEALALARRNAHRHGVQERIRFLQGDLLQPLQGPSSRSPAPAGLRLRVSGGLDIIAANLPYVRTADWERLPPEIREHEPRDGLDGGPDGLRVIERLLREAPPYLKPGGAVFVEIGDEHGDAACRMAGEAFPGAQIEVKPDLSGLDRVLVIAT